MKWLIVPALAVLAGCCSLEVPSPILSGEIVSPDGKNLIRFKATEPFAYEVVREGVTVIPMSEIALTVDNQRLGGTCLSLVTNRVVGTTPASVYKHDRLKLTGNELFFDYGNWGVRLVARNDGVAYRFETKILWDVTVDAEVAEVKLADNARLWYCQTPRLGCEEKVPRTADFGEVNLGADAIYLPLVAKIYGKSIAITESDVYDYPILNYVKAEGALESRFAKFPKRTFRSADWDWKLPCPEGGRWVLVSECEDFLVKTSGSRTFPWRVFMLADSPAKFCEADIVEALARPSAPGADFSWVKPGKVAWDWWNAFDNQGEKDGCNTATYRRFIDFAAKNQVEYVIMDEGWSEELNIWKLNPKVDVPAIIKYASERKVGIILWVAWAQVVGKEEQVAEHFAKFGVKGFKVDFMDRGDAECERFLWKFAEATARHHLLVDYHGAHRPTGMSRAYPNVVNYEGVHGLEQMKFFGKENMMANDVRAFFLRMTAGPMDYTPGAMVNYPIGKYAGSNRFPGSEGTRAHQMAMMSLYFAPLQMLSDSPTNYEKNMESFEFMAKVPTVWKSTVALGGSPDTFAACARQAPDGSWYAAAINNADGRGCMVNTAFLGPGKWKKEIFRDADDANVKPEHYVHEFGEVTAGDKFYVRMAAGGGFIIRFSK